MTTNVMKTIASRPGNGAPFATVSGSASAAASETIPRIPDQPTSSSVCHAGSGSRSRSAWNSARGSHAAE